MNWQISNKKSKPEPRPASKPVLATKSAPVLFVDATAHHCRYPLWDDATPVEDRTVCGAPVSDGASWCVGHSELVFANDQGSDRRGPTQTARPAHKSQAGDEAVLVKAAA